MKRHHRVMGPASRWHVAAPAASSRLVDREMGMGYNYCVILLRKDVSGLDRNSSAGNAE